MPKKESETEREQQPSQPGATPVTDEIITLCTETMTGDVRDFLLDRLKHDHNPLPWHMRPEAEQREIAERAETSARYFVSRVVKLIAAEGRKVIVGTVKRVVVKDGIEATITCSKTDALRHELMDAQGDEVLLVVSGAEQFEGARGPVRINPDQKALFDDDEQDGSGNPDDSEEDPDADPDTTDL